MLVLRHHLVLTRYVHILSGEGLLIIFKGLVKQILVLVLSLLLLFLPTEATWTLLSLFARITAMKEGIVFDQLGPSSVMRVRE